MLAFLDFEASSLSRWSYPIEVAWIFEDGHSEAYLIRPAPAWTEWDLRAQAIHGIAREALLEQGEPHDLVARRMLEALSGHDLRASAPSWDGKWLSMLLRGAGLPRHSLRLKDSDEAFAEAAREILSTRVAPADLERAIEEVLMSAAVVAARTPSAHRALADAEAERRQWLAVRQAAYAWQPPRADAGGDASLAGGSPPSP